MILPEKLIEDVKTYLDITWEMTPAEKNKLSGIISRGIRYINNAAGRPQNFIREAKARELLFDYCRYARDSALHEFMQNYLSELLSLQIGQEVAHFCEQNANVQ